MYPCISTPGDAPVEQHTDRGQQLVGTSECGGDASFDANGLDCLMSDFLLMGQRLVVPDIIAFPNSTPLLYTYYLAYIKIKSLSLIDVTNS